jgi:hypothetical protein
MKSLARFVLPATAVLIGFTSCEKSPAPKFKPGDRVKTIMGAEGIVFVRLRPSREDVYYIKIPGGAPDRESWYQQFPEDRPAYHESGPNDAADLRLLPK